MSASLSLESTGDIFTSILIDCGSGCYCNSVPLGEWYRDMVINSGYLDTSGVLLALSNSLCLTVASSRSAF